MIEINRIIKSNCNITVMNETTVKFNEPKFQ